MTLAPTRRVNYDLIAADYDRRFEHGGPRGVTEALVSLADAVRACRVLEVGCGTGYWLHALRRTVPSCHGLDLSRGMLGKASGRGDGDVSAVDSEAYDRWVGGGVGGRRFFVAPLAAGTGFGLEFSREREQSGAGGRYSE